MSDSQNETTDWRQEIKAILADANLGPPTDGRGCCVECGSWTPWGHPHTHDHEEGCAAEARYAARRDWKGRLRALVAT